MTVGGPTASGGIDHYDWHAGDRGGREAMLRFGPDRGPVVIVALPLFEEANRTRATIVAMLRALAGRGIAGALPDLPGQGESLIATRAARLTDWRAAFAAATTASGAAHVVAVRGGALIDVDAEAESRWHLSPTGGAAQIRELNRQRSVAEGDSPLFAGNDVSADLVAAIDDAEPRATGLRRVVRLVGDPRPADIVLPFAPPWRTAEPQRDEALAAALAEDIAAWVAACAG